MRRFKTVETSRSIVLFCRLVKLGKPCTAKSMCCSARTANLIKTVLTNKFVASSGAPFDFPRLFICDDKRGHMYHKCTTPNDIDLGDLKTIEQIEALMTYVGRTKRGGETKSTTVKSDEFSFDLKDAQKIVLARSGKELTLKIIFR